jgi:CYTH domain-containing protein
MAKEIERKFLVKGETWRELASGEVYRQGYLSTGKEHTVRARVIGTEAYLTIKGPNKGAARLEYEYEIPLQDAEELLAELCEHPPIEKTRYKISFGGLVWEVDEFSGENEGLIIAEVELSDEEQEIKLPEWIGEEVTGDPRYLNANLVKFPYRRW